jgi:hypothetical protein
MSHQERQEEAIEMPGVPLGDWVAKHPVRDEMLWKGGAERQIDYVEDTLLPIFLTGFKFKTHEEYEKEFPKLVTVINSHCSKSIELPVFQLRRPDMDLRIILRNNFMDWKMSVVSDTPIQANFDGIFHTTPPVERDYTGDDLGSCYFEGFPEDLIFGYHGESDGRRWSASIRGETGVTLAVFEMMRSLGKVKPLAWGTRGGNDTEYGYR